MLSDYLTIEQVAAKLGIHPKTVRRYISGGKLSAQKIAGAWRINPESLAVYFDSCDRAGAVSSSISKDDFCIFMDGDYFNSEDVLQACTIIDCYVSSEQVKELLTAVMGIVADCSINNQKSRFNYVYDDADSKIRLVFWGLPSFMAAIMNVVKDYE